MMKIYCEKCGLDLGTSPTHTPHDDRAPCPRCESVDRRFSVEIGSLTAQATVTAFDATTTATPTGIGFDIPVHLLIEHLDDEYMVRFEIKGYALEEFICGPADVIALGVHDILRALLE